MPILQERMEALIHACDSQIAYTDQLQLVHAGQVKMLIREMREALRKSDTDTVWQLVNSLEFHNDELEKAQAPRWIAEVVTQERTHFQINRKHNASRKRTMQAMRYRAEAQTIEAPSVNRLRADPEKDRALAEHLAENERFRQGLSSEQEPQPQPTAPPPSSGTLPLPPNVPANLYDQLDFKDGIF